jgi:hypothetical protein
MAERDIVGGLFGVTPEMYQQARQQQQMNEAVKMGSLTPAQFIGTQAYRGGQALGNVAGSLLGVEDPELMKIRDVQQMRTQFDTSSAAGLRAFARSLAEKGYTDLAMQAATKADGMAKALLDQNKVAEETRILGREIKEIGIPGNPELVIKAAVDKDGNIINYVGEPYSRFSQKTSIKVDTGDKNVLDVDKEDAKNLVKLRDASERTIPRLEEQLVAVKKGMVSGSLNDARKVMLNSLATFGIKDKNTVDLLANTDKFNANRIELASAVAKQLGVNPTDKDFQASLDRFASGSMQPQVAETFINDMLTIQRKNLQDAQAGLNYYRENRGSFRGYNRPLPQSPIVSDPLANLSLDQLKALEKQLTTGKK